MNLTFQRIKKLIITVMTVFDLNSNIHHKVSIYIHLQFKSEFKENDLAST